MAVWQKVISYLICIELKQSLIKMFKIKWRAQAYNAQGHMM